MQSERTDLAGILAEFETARDSAVQATEAYRRCPPLDPEREHLFREVVTATEAAEQRLRRWLDLTQFDQPPPN